VARVKYVQVAHFAGVGVFGLVERYEILLFRELHPLITQSNLLKYWHTSRPHIPPFSPYPFSHNHKILHTEMIATSVTGGYTPQHLLYPHMLHGFHQVTAPSCHSQQTKMYHPASEIWFLKFLLNPDKALPDSSPATLSGLIPLCPHPWIKTCHLYYTCMY
jgi:hypothetical protein